MRLLSVHLDTLECQWWGRLRDDARLRIREASRALTAGEDVDPWPGGETGPWHWRRARRSGYSVELVAPEVEDLRFLFADGTADRPTCTAIYGPRRCWGLLPAEIAEEQLGTCAMWIGASDQRVDVGRIDIAWDLAGWQPSEEPQAWVTRARRRDAHTVSEMLQATRDDVEAGEVIDVSEVERATSHNVGHRWSGWTFAMGSPLSKRVYDKRLEAGPRPRKAWILQEYATGSWRLRDDEILWRAEAQIRTPVLRELVPTRRVQDVLARDHLNGVGQYVTRKWICEVKACQATRRERAQITPGWGLIRSALPAETPKRQPPPPSETLLRNLRLQMLGTAKALWRASGHPPARTAAEFLEWARNQMGVELTDAEIQKGTT